MLRTTNFDPGGFAEYVRVPAVNVERGVFRIPETMSFEVASFSEPLGCVVRGARLAGLKPGMCVLVIGSGISGLLHIKLAKAFGAAFIVATDINDYRLRAATLAGADLAIKATADVAREMNKKFKRLADIVFLCASADSAIKQALVCVERAGTIVFFAPKMPEETYPVPLFDLWKDNITFRNTYASPPGDTLEAIELMASARVDVRDLITHRLPLEDAAKGFKLVAKAGDSIKVIIEPHGSES
jgi:L-iditol 2-dehydrogenase